MTHSVDNSNKSKKAVEDYDNLDMTGKSVLVQNQLGIFYGTLEKADTRSGTALLRNGFMISPEHHITFTKYLDFLSAEANEISFEFYSKDTDETEPEDSDPSELELPDEIQIDTASYSEHAQNLTITDYAVDGISLVQFRTTNYWNTNYHQSVARLISLTNIFAVVPVNADKSGVIEHEEFEIAKYGEYDNLSPYPLGNLFETKPEDIQFTPEDTFRYMLQNSGVQVFAKLLESIKNGNGDKKGDDIGLTQYLNPLGLKKGKSLPKLVVNTAERVAEFKQLKQAQTDEQAK